MSRSARIKERVHERNLEISKLETEVRRLGDIVQKQAILLAKAECLAKDFISLMGGGEANGVVLPPKDVDTPANSETLEREKPEVEQ